MDPLLTRITIGDMRACAKHWLTQKQQSGKKMVPVAPHKAVAEVSKIGNL